MTHTAMLALDNIRYLNQGIDLLNDLDDVSYCFADPRFFHSGVGGHIRHNLDHYRSFLDGMETGKLDYDARERDPRIESEREHAILQMRRVIQALMQISEHHTQREILVKVDCGDESEDAISWHHSTVGRELQFLVSHTVHHYALVAIIVKLQGCEPSEEFGVAPSTLRYHQQNLSCVPQPG